MEIFYNFVWNFLNFLLLPGHAVFESPNRLTGRVCLVGSCYYRCSVFSMAAVGELVGGVWD
jgi:hypothetical protein